MVASMTGFGRKTAKVGDKTVTVEIKTVNNKYLDVYLKLPQIFRSKETDIRRLLADFVVRGKTEVTISTNDADLERAYTINRAAVLSYYQQLTAIGKEMNITVGESLLAAILRMPEIISGGNIELPDEEWHQLQTLIKDALTELLQYRLAEGSALEADFEEQIADILQRLQTVKTLAPQRLTQMRERITKALHEWQLNEKADKNRFEQELLYYLEKLDINEEVVRLTTHCHYFLTEMRSTNKTEKGKKLNFITQEIGREINTIGSKANDANIQVEVVQMKDALERIKEQLLNII